MNPPVIELTVPADHAAAPAGWGSEYQGKMTIGRRSDNSIVRLLRL